MARVTVVGGGVMGLTSALGLARAGHAVRCVRDAPVADTTSAVAGGLWFPYRVEPRDRVLDWGRAAFDRFAALARDPDAGVALREGVVVERGVGRPVVDRRRCRAGARPATTSCPPARPAVSWRPCRSWPCRCSCRGSRPGASRPASSSPTAT